MTDDNHECWVFQLRYSINKDDPGDAGRYEWIYKGQSFGDRERWIAGSAPWVSGTLLFVPKDGADIVKVELERIPERHEVLSIIDGRDELKHTGLS